MTNFSSFKRAVITKYIHNLSDTVNTLPVEGLESLTWLCIISSWSLYGHLVVQWSPLQWRHCTIFCWLWLSFLSGSSFSCCKSWKCELSNNFYLFNFKRAKNCSSWKIFNPLLTFHHVKLTSRQSTALEQEHFNLWSISPAFPNLKLLLAKKY